MNRPMRNAGVTILAGRFVLCGHETSFGSDIGRLSRQAFSLFSCYGIV